MKTRSRNERADILRFISSGQPFSAQNAGYEPLGNARQRILFSSSLESPTFHTARVKSGQSFGRPERPLSDPEQTIAQPSASSAKGHFRTFPGCKSVRVARIPESRGRLIYGRPVRVKADLARAVAIGHTLREAVQGRRWCWKSVRRPLCSVLRPLYGGISRDGRGNIREATANHCHLSDLSVRAPAIGRDRVIDRGERTALKSIGDAVAALGESRRPRIGAVLRMPSDPCAVVIPPPACLVV